MVLWKNIFLNIRHYVVSLDIPKIKDRSVVEPGMEIFITHQHGEFIDSNIDGDIGVAFLIADLRFNIWGPTIFNLKYKI